jgi:hypothetical protein
VFPPRRTAYNRCTIGYGLNCRAIINLRFGHPRNLPRNRRGFVVSRPRLFSFSLYRAPSSCCPRGPYHEREPHPARSRSGDDLAIWHGSAATYENRILESRFLLACRSASASSAERNSWHLAKSNRKALLLLDERTSLPAGQGPVFADLEARAIRPTRRVSGSTTCGPI